MAKQLRIIAIAAFFIIAAASLAFGVFYGARRYLAAQVPAIRSVVCSKTGVSHTATIKDDKVMPGHTEAVACDTLTITNDDNRLRLLAFGPHDHHEAYDGVVTKLLGQGQSFTITLNRTGTYSFHDHDDETVASSFTVR